MTNIIIIGGGIAGLQAAVYTAKAGEDTKVIDSGESLVKNTSNIQNLIGHESISGHELLRSGKEKLEDFGGEIYEEEVKEVREEDEGFAVETGENEYEADYLIVASAGDLSFVEHLVQFEEGEEGPYMMDRHINTDDRNRASENLYAAGLANTWEYQTSVALGDGTKAAVNLLSELYGEPYEDHDT